MVSIKQKLLKLLELFDKEAKQYKLEYSIDGGTLLGAVRHTNIIPWDDDVDVIVVNTKKNIKLLKKIFKKLNKHHINFIKNDDGYKLFYNNGTKIRTNPWIEHMNQFKKTHPEIKGRLNITHKASLTYTKKKKGLKLYKKYTFPFLDILLVTIKNKRSYYIKKKWDKCHHTTNNLFPLKTYKISNIHVMGPSKPIDYLDSCYKDWDMYGYKSYDHKNEKILKKTKFKIKHKNYKKNYQ
jgi:phosphorylcholine metabolism protein LicD